jgi:hypothetical protein
MKGRLSTCEADTGDTANLLRILEDTPQQINFEEFSVVTVKGFF